MNLNKHLEFFDPTLVVGKINIIGCGALGSHVAEQLVRLGCDNLVLWDFDEVSPHNITNQIFYHDQIGQAKTTALQDTLKRINPSVNIKLKGKYEDQNLSGYVFMMVDSIQVRNEIVNNIYTNPNVRGVFDARMRLTDAQSYGADWTSTANKEMLKNSMQFSSEEAKAATPVSACGTTLSVTPTVKIVSSVTVSNFMNLITKDDVKTVILLDAFAFTINAF